MWLETTARLIKDIKKMVDGIPKIENMKEINALELKIHNMFQECYGVLGNVTREVKQAINAQKLNVKKNERVRKEVEQNQAIERILNEAPEQEIVDATKLDEPKPKKKTTKKKTTKKADK